jgi:Anti-sigma-K factor rskA
MNDHHRFRELLGPHVLGLLEPDEERQMQRHLIECRMCREEEAELNVVHRGLTNATTPPPSQLKGRTMERLRRRRWRISGAIAAAAVLLVVLFLGSVYPAFLRPQDAVAAAATLSPTRQAPGASGEVRLEGTGANMHIRLEVSGLYSLRSDEYYEMWFLKGDRRISCGGFTVDSEGRATVTMNAPKAAYAGYPYVVITREESTGNPLPSPTRVLEGEIHRA